MLGFVATMAWAGDCGVEARDGRVPDPGLAFVPREATLTPEGAAAVAKVACALTEDPALKLRIEVHTDAQGMDTYNLRISQQRADAVRDALIAAGVAADRLTAAGCGEVYPLTDNLTAEGRAKNRRVELWAPTPLGRDACPVVEVPPAAPPAPPPAPAPVPRVPSDCASWAALSPSRPAAWPGARCEGGADWSCRVPVPVGDVVAAAATCLTGSWDGAEWIAPGEGWALVLTSEGQGTRLQAR